jgi:hypothetical protein
MSESKFFDTDLIKKITLTHQMIRLKKIRHKIQYAVWKFIDSKSKKYALIATKRGDLQEAIFFWTKAEKLFPKDPECFNNKINCLSELHNKTTNSALPNAKTLDIALSKNIENIIVFLVPPVDGISGGILSIFSIYEETKKLKKIHGSEVIMCTYPGNQTVSRYTMFDNDVDICSFDQLTNHFETIKKIIIHIPEYSCLQIVNNLDEDKKRWLTNIPHAHINVLNQNIELMPTPDEIKILRNYCTKLTITTAHDSYSNIDQALKYNCSLHKFSTYIDPKKYEITDFSKKNFCIAISPDVHEAKKTFFEIIDKDLPTLEKKVISGMTYRNYLELSKSSKFSITFGEGLDAYFVESALFGGVPFAIYNDVFFTPEFASLPTVFSSHQEMLEKLPSMIADFSQNPDKAIQVSKDTRLVIERLYNFNNYLDNLKRFYLGDYDFKI